MKNTNEWSLEFDQMYQNITSNQAPGLTEYEKSVRLTRAEWDIIVMLYKGSLGKSFEETEELTHYLNYLVAQYESSSPVSGVPHIVSGSKVFELPDDMLFRTLEICRIAKEGCGSVDAVVVPVTQDEYWRTSRDPFKKQNANRVLRLSYGSSEEFSTGLYNSQYSELVSDFPIEAYIVRYVTHGQMHDVVTDINRIEQLAVTLGCLLLVFSYIGAAFAFGYAEQSVKGNQASFP